MEEKTKPICKDSLLHFRGTKKLLIGMVGLPARGKTYISRKLCRYLNWIGYNTKTFVVAEYRRKLFGHHGDHHYFNPLNEKAMDERTQSAIKALEDLFKYLLHSGGQAAIFDGTNITKARRDLVDQQAEKNQVQVIWIESICRDKAIVDYYIDEIEARSPDFEAHEDVKREMYQVIRHYETVYEPLAEDSEFSYVKLIDAGRQVVSNKMGGYLEGRLVSFLINLRLYNKNKVLYISRHGESEYNLEGKIGGDSSITKAGQGYAALLGEWIGSQPEVKGKKLAVWCSTLRRTIETAGVFKDQAIAWHPLREIDVGICDGMTYEEVEQKYPEEFAARKKDKLRYRYPRGESYMDVIARLEPVICELEKVDGPTLVIAHRAVLRCLFAYFLDSDHDKIPYLEVPLHTAIRLYPKTYGYEVSRYPLGERIEEKEDARGKPKATSATTMPASEPSAPAPITAAKSPTKASAPATITTTATTTTPQTASEVGSGRDSPIGSVSPRTSMKVTAAATAVVAPKLLV